MRATDWLLTAMLVGALGGCSAAPLRHPGRTTRPHCIVEQQVAETPPVLLDGGLWDTYCLERLLHARHIEGPRLVSVLGPERDLLVPIPAPGSRELPPGDLPRFELDGVPRELVDPVHVSPADEAAIEAEESPEGSPVEVELDVPASPPIESIEESGETSPEIERAPSPPRNELPPASPPRNILPARGGEANQSGSMIQFAEDAATTPTARR